MTLNALAYGPPPREYTERIRERVASLGDRFTNESLVRVAEAISEYRTDIDFYRESRAALDRVERTEALVEHYQSLILKKGRVNKMTRDALVAHPTIEKGIREKKLAGFKGITTRGKESLYYETVSGYMDEYIDEMSYTITDNDMSELDIEILRQNYHYAMSRIALGEDPTII